MNKTDSIIVIENQKNNFFYKKNKSNLNITFNRVSFIFFVFFIVSIIYTIHLLHLGSRKVKTENINNQKQTLSKLYRADIVDVNQKYLVKTVSSIDIGISPSKIIDEKKLLLNLKYIFPDKNYDHIKKKLKKVSFFILKKRFQRKIMKI
tara:strand:- start:183 stop:629 length:447 start_codon:yes stop_codon:yes gene_type:complete